MPSPPASRLPTVIALLVGTFLSSLDVTVVGTAMPRIVSELRGMNLYGWVFSGYLLASTATVPIYGKLADLIGRRTTYFIGLGLFLAGSGLCGAATWMPMLVAARVLQGMGGGALFPVTQTIMGDLFPVEERARVQGVFALVWGISSVIGPAVGGAFVSFWTWRWTFFINLPVGAGAWLLLAASYRESPRKERPPIDVAGALLLAAALSLLLAGLGKDGVSPLFLVAGVLLIALFVLVERRVAAPVIPPDLFRDRVFAIACVANFLLGAVLFAFIAYVPLYLQGVAGISPFTAGMLGAPVSLTWTLCSFLAGRMILARGYRPVLRAGGLLVGGAALATAIAAASSERPPVAFALFECGQLLLGAGMGLSSTALVIMVQDRAPWERRGVVTATLQLTRQIGMTLGTAALGALLVALLLRRLSSVANAPAPEALLNPTRWAELAPSVLIPSRAALGSALQRITYAVVALAAVCSVAAFVFPGRPCYIVGGEDVLMREYLTFGLVSLSAVFFVVDPLAAIPLFLAMTHNETPQQRARTALRASFTSGLTLTLFALAGGLIFKFFGISLGAFKIAGGVLLFLLALDMMKAQPSRTRQTPEEERDAIDKDDVAIIPLAIPLLSGPGSIATVMVLMTRHTEWTYAVPVFVAIVVTAILTYVLLRAASWMRHRLSRTFLNVMTRVMGLILAAISVEFIVAGVKDVIPGVLAR